MASVTKTARRRPGQQHRITNAARMSASVTFGCPDIFASRDKLCVGLIVGPFEPRSERRPQSVLSARLTTIVFGCRDATSRRCRSGRYVVRWWTSARLNRPCELIARSLVGQRCTLPARRLTANPRSDYLSECGRCESGRQRLELPDLQSTHHGRSRWYHFQSSALWKIAAVMNPHVAPAIADSNATSANVRRPEQTGQSIPAPTGAMSRTMDTVANPTANAVAVTSMVRMAFTVAACVDGAHCRAARQYHHHWDGRSERQLCREAPGSPWKTWTTTPCSPLSRSSTRVPTGNFGFRFDMVDCLLHLDAGRQATEFCA